MTSRRAKPDTGTEVIVPEGPAMQTHDISALEGRKPPVACGQARSDRYKMAMPADGLCPLFALRSVRWADEGAKPKVDTRQGALGVPKTLPLRARARARKEPLFCGLRSI